MTDPIRLCPSTGVNDKRLYLVLNSGGCACVRVISVVRAPILLLSNTMNKKTIIIGQYLYFFKRN